MSHTPVLITGAAGFIGFGLARRLLEGGGAVVGVDNLNSYYDPALKEARLSILRQFENFRFCRLDLADREAVATLFSGEEFGPVVHFAAQAGVRHSLQQPHAYLDANLAGFLNVLEGCRQRKTPHLVYASSSSVYGANTTLPFSVRDRTDRPVSLYGATKKANEVMAHSYSHLFALPTTGLRLFTVYGPWGRPDMAIFTFAKALMDGQPIKLFNYGRMRRDFTYVDDVVEAVERLIPKPPPIVAPESRHGASPGENDPPWRLYNVGNNRSIEISRVVELLERAVGRKARTELLPLQPGDVLETCADIDDLVRDVAFRPKTPIEDGICRFVEWYTEYRLRCLA
ncbi:MAG: SDR family NAD(P)-dependent oxidoreductase [Xanthobacteraceae bacterium]